MSVETFEVNAEYRTELGKGASRRLRHAKKVPAIVYGANQEPVSITLALSEIWKHLEHEAFYSHVLTLKLPDKQEKVVLRDLQRHVYKPTVLHVDFQRISGETKIHMVVPIHFTHEDKCIGVKQGGGTISHVVSEVEIECLADKLPEYIEVDMTNIEAGKTIHLSELVLPEGVEIKALKHGADHDSGVVTVLAPRGSGEAEE